MRVSQAQGTEDYYATLGVEPRSEAAAIRSAYLALMRRYHPDKNDSPAAVERAHAIIAAFAVLGDVEKRLHYDWGRRRAAEAAEEARRSWRGWGPRAFTAVAGALLLLVTVMVMPVPVPMEAPKPLAARVAPAAVVAEAVPVRMEMPPASFLAPVPVAPVEPEPVVEDVVVPPVIAPRPRATAEVPVAPRARLPMRAAAKAAAPRATTSARCRLARPGAETAICNDDNLAALDRNVVTFYNQSLIFAAATKRGALLDARESFLARRAACRSDACLRTLHLAHLREMSAIVEHRPATPAP